MLFRRLHQFVHLFEYQNSSRTAATLGLPKSTLSTSISQLEEALACRLFRQYAHGVRPLQAAWDLYPVAHEALAELLILEAAFKSPQASPDQVLVKCPLSMTAGAWFRNVRQSSFAERNTGRPVVTLVDRRTDAPQADSWPNPAYSIDIHAEPPTNVAAIAPLSWLLVSMERTTGLSPDATVGVEDLASRRLALPALSARELRAFRHGVGLSLRHEPTVLDRAPWDLASYLAMNPSVGVLVPEHALLPALGCPPFQINRVALEGPAPLLCLAAQPGGAVTSSGIAHVAEELRRRFDRPQEGAAWAPPVSYKEIRYFEAAYESRNVSDAARRLYVVQPAVSKKLMDLERRLDRRLFDRSRVGLTPLDAAHQLHRSTARLAGLASPLMHRSAGGENRDDILSISCLPPYDESSSIALALRDTLEEWNRLYPLIKLNALEGLSRKQHSWLQEGRVSAAVVESLFDTDHLVVTLLRRDPMVVLFGRGYAASEVPEEVPIEGLPEYRLVLPSRYHGIRTSIDRQLASHNIVVKPVMEIDSLTTISAVAGSGRYATILPDIGRIRDQVTPGMLKRPIQGGRLVRDLYLLRRTEVDLSVVENKVIATLQKHFQR